MRANEDTTGLILAGGAGRRVGGEDKGLLDWHGKPLAAHVAERLRPQVKRLVISCNRNRDYYATLADATVADRRENFQGPLAGLEAAASQLEGDTILIAPCDTPLLPRDLASRLLDALSAAGDSMDISYAHDGERGHYLCAAIRSRILPSLATFLATGQRAVRHWYALHHCVVVDFSSEADCFRNYNRPE